MSAQTILLQANEITRACEKLLENVGVPQDQAKIIADVIVQADLRGIESHGILRLPAYIKRVLAGTMTADTQLAVLQEHSASMLLDAQYGFGQVAAHHAMNCALSKAATHGTAVVAVRNAGHFGIAAYYGMMALRQEMIGFVFANASPSMAAWGGTMPLLGTNPICVAIPTGEEVDIVLDMASSIVARGKIRLAINKGDQIPLNWALDSKGLPTRDPEAAMQGTLLPIGGPKGYGLALVVDVLSGVLTGSSFGKHISTTLDYDSNVSAGLLVQALDITAFTEVETFYQNIQSLISDIRQSPYAPGVECIYLPGEIEYLRQKERLQKGIPVPVSLLLELGKMAKVLDVEIDLPID